MSTISARMAVSLGQCSAPCLVAYQDTACDCRCGGTYHGVLADVEIEAKPLPPGRCGAPAPPDPVTGEQPAIYCEREADHAPRPRMFEHHNGSYGMWLEVAESSTDTLDVDSWEYPVADRSQVR